MCPWAYQTSVWIRRVREEVDLDIDWRFFSLEEVNRPEGKRHPWERPLAYGWTPMRVAALLRRTDMDACDRWYEACGKALHEDGRRFYDAAVAHELLESIGARPEMWEAALGRPDHARRRARRPRARRVPLRRRSACRSSSSTPTVRCSDQSSCPAPSGDDALALWDLTVAYAKVPGLFELKTPKTAGDLRTIATAFAPYLDGPRVADHREPGTVGADVIPHRHHRHARRDVGSRSASSATPSPRSSGRRRPTCRAGPCRTTCPT